MDKKEYDEILSHMRREMDDSAHDSLHVTRVLYAALDIAETEENVDYDVLTAACLLHDIGRKRQFENPEVCHAEAGAEMAFDYLLKKGWSEQKAVHVAKCIASHRYRGGNKPESIEAKILFDADKLDVTGALGIARTLIYGGRISEPIYILDDNGNIVTDETEVEPSSFFQEYKYKLNSIFGQLYTERAKNTAAARKKAMDDFYESLFCEIDETHKTGENRLSRILGKKGNFGE